MDRIDRELERLPPLPAASRDRMLAALREELPRGPGPHQWRAEIVRVVVAVLAVTAAIGVALIASGNASLAMMLDRLAVFAGGAALCAFAAYVALAPRGRRGQLIASILFPFAAVALVLVRRPVGVASSPEWVCTVTHLAASAVPLTVGLLALRRGGAGGLAGFALGVAAGTTGAMVGEVACGRDATHVLVFHVSAWALMVALGAVASHFLPVRSHAQ